VKHNSACRVIALEGDVRGFFTDHGAEPGNMGVLLEARRCASSYGLPSCAYAAKISISTEFLATSKS